MATDGLANFRDLGGLPTEDGRTYVPELLADTGQGVVTG